MSFQPKSFWMPRDAGCLTDGEMSYDSSSRIEPKRAQQWFMDGSAPELFSSKKQAKEGVNMRTVPGLHMNLSWENTPSFHSAPGPFTDRLLGPEPLLPVVDRSISPVGNTHVNVERKDSENQYGNDTSMGLSMSHSIEDPSSCIDYGGIRKVKVNQVRESENGMSAASMGCLYGSRDTSTISMGTRYSKNDENIISLGPTYSRRVESNISMGTAFSKTGDNFISMGQIFNKGDGNFISMGHTYNKGGNGTLSMGQPFDKEDGTFISIGQSYEKEDCNVISLGTSYNKGHENFVSMGPSYSKANENSTSMVPAYNKGNNDTLSMDPTYNKGDSSALSMGHIYNKGESNAISFCGFDEEPETNPSGGIISGYDLVMGNQNSQASEVSTQKDAVYSNSDVNVNTTPKANSKIETPSKNKEQKITKKVPPNSFPSNVKSLLSTGMLDGVPVKYISWARDKKVTGVVKGTGYLCSCEDCKESKVLNAYEFERHAGCKTKHPNNHIYFENGKSIYAVVQELKNTRQEILFDMIQNVTGSPINQKNFRAWKASYQAATRELQRIYGKDEVIMPT